MILPYYNCLLVAHRYSEIQLEEEDEHLIKDYLQGALRERKQVSTIILVSSLGDKNSSLQLRMHNILHMLITNLGVQVHELSNSYTQSQQTKQIYDALQSISVCPNQSAKIPILQGISPLQSYYTHYSSAKQMKEFLKWALIEEFNADRKIIRYRTTEQVELYLKRQSDSLQGQIKIVHDDASLTPISSNIYILLHSHKQALPEILIRRVEQHYPINKEINAILTWEHTLSTLERKAQSKLCSLFSNWLLHRQVIVLEEITSLRKNILLHCCLGGIFGLAERLRVEEAQKEQFLAFVKEMNAKYTKQLSLYFIAFREQVYYQHSLKEFRERMKNQNKIGKYLFGFVNSVQMRRKQLTQARSNCSKLQKAIFAFLLRRRTKRESLELYLSSKREERAKHIIMYQQIRNLLNEMQLQKVRKYNGHKYGFNCCLHILQLNSLSNSPCFSPMLLLKQLQKLSKKRDPLARINCYQNSIDFVTVQGKILGLKQRLPQLYQFGALFQDNKQNIENNYESIVEQITHPKILSNSDETAFEMCRFQKYRTPYTSLMRSRERSESEVIQQFYASHPQQSIRYSHSQGGFGVFVTAGGKLFHWGKGKLHFPSCNSPQTFEIASKLAPKQVAIGTRDLYVLTANNKVYSTLHQSNIRLPKQVEQEFDQFHLVKVGNNNISICYLLAYKTDSQDKLRQKQINNFLTSASRLGATTHDSMLVESLGQIKEISSILEESLPC